MPATIGDIAAAVGVSKMTVSRALRGVPGIGSETRSQILSVARQMRYRPNTSAQAVRSGRFGSIVLLASSVQHRGSTLPGAIEAVQEQLGKLDYRLILARLPDEKLTNEQYIQHILREMAADGLLINYIQRIPQRLVELVRDYEIPAIWMNTRWPMNCVYPDDVDGAAQAVEHLIRLGHRRIAYLDYSHRRDRQEDHYSAFARWEGYCEAMTQHGLTPRQLEPAADVPAGERMQAAARALSHPERPTAVIAYTIAHATAVLLAAMSMGLRVPEDLSVMTFSDRRSFSQMGMPITSMMLPENGLGDSAVSMLIHRIEESGVPVPARVHRFTFQEGATVAPPIP